VNRRQAIENAPVARRVSSGLSLGFFLMLGGLLAAPGARAQSSAPPPPGEYPPGPVVTPAPGSYPPGQFPPPGYPPPTAYAPPPGWVPVPPEPPHPRRVLSLTISPIHLLLPVVELTAEARVHDKVGLALVGGAGKVTDRASNISADAYEAGAQIRVYVLGDFRHGMQLGAEALYLHVSLRDVVASGEGLAIGPFIGYKVMVDAGFTFDTQVGFERVALRATANGSSDSESEYIPLINLNIGWSF
jgi:hypothetical protein